MYPELALTTFFPRWFVDDITEADHWYERSMPNADTQPLFDEARRLGIGFCLGYALLEDGADGVHRWNVQTLVERDGSIVATFKKVHIPGHEEHEPDRPFQHAERYYFEPSPDGFGVWDAFGGRVGMMICNDRRWPESYREMGLQGVELILCGYNTPLHYAPDPSQDPLQGFHNSLVMQSGAYQNGTFVVGVAKGGIEEGVPSLCDSRIIAPSGEVLAAADHRRRRADRRRLRPRLVQAVHGHAVRLRPLSPAGGVHPPHGAARRADRDDEAWRPMVSPWSRRVRRGDEAEVDDRRSRPTRPGAERPSMASPVASRDRGCGAPPGGSDRSALVAIVGRCDRRQRRRVARAASDEIGLDRYRRPRRRDARRRSPLADRADDASVDRGCDCRSSIRVAEGAAGRARRLRPDARRSSRRPPTSRRRWRATRDQRGIAPVDDDRRLKSARRRPAIRRPGSTS